MELSRGILKNFAKITDDSSKKTASTSVHATAVVADGKKYAKIDGSNVLTPIAETTDVQTGDRILVTVENHTAVVIGNFTYPPSARNEQKALEESSRASSTANSAIEKAAEAQSLAADANTISAQANTSASQAIASAQQASTLAQNAQAAASDANTKSDSAIASANSSLEQSAAAQKQLDALKAEIETVQGDVADARAEAIASVNAVKEEISVNYAKKTDVTTVEGSLKAEITKSVAELQSTISEQYTAKSDSVALEERLQSQITQNADSISSVVSRTTRLETDTSEAQKQIDAAKASATAAQSTADAAQAAAKTAKDNADAAQSAAETAQANASAAQATADAAKAKADAANTAAANAQTDLDNAKANLTEVTNRVGATEEEIAAAQQKVDEAQTAADQAIANAASANSAAATAQSAADKAKADAANAQSAAATAKTKADSASAAAATAQAAADKAQADADALKSRVTTCETNISQNAEAIALRATKTELTDQINTASQAIIDNLEDNYYTKTQTDSAIQVKADSILSTVSSTYQTKNAMTNYSTTTQMNTAINQKADSITQSISATYATKSSLETANSNIVSLTSRVQKAESKLTKDGLTTIVGDYYTTANVVDSKINGIEIGGRNLAIETNQGTYRWGWMTQNSGTVTMEEVQENSIRCCKFTRTSTDVGGWSVIYYNIDNRSKYEAGKTYTVSFEVKASVNTFFHCNLMLGDGTDGLAYSVSHVQPNASANTWKKCVFVLTLKDILPTSTGQVLYLSGMNSNAGVSYIFRNLMIEKGNKATDWTPAPEDVDSSISAVQTIATQTADKFNWLVKSGTSSTDFTLTDRTASLVANYINLNGLVTFSGLDSAAKNSIIDSVQVGGRNLYYTNAMNKLTFSHASSAYASNGEITLVASGYDLYMGEVLYEGDSWTERNSPLMSVDGASYVTFSVSNPLFTKNIYNFLDSDKKALSGYIGIEKSKGTIAVPSGAKYISMRFGYGSAVSGTTYKLKIKVELGNKATDWTPAPEDVDSSISTAQSTADSAKTAAGTAQSTADTARNEIASLGSITVKRYGIDGASGSAKWFKLGTLVSNGDCSSTIITVYSGDGYNGIESQNSQAEIVIKDGWQPSQSATTSFGVSVTRQNCESLIVKVMASSHNTCDVWVYMPWGYWNGMYTIVGSYSSWTHSGTYQDSEPSSGVSQSVGYRANAENAQSSANLANTTLANWCYNNDKTYINGGKIYTGTIAAAQIASSAITAAKIAAGAVTADKISVTSLEAICAKIGGFTIGSSALYNNTTSLAGAANSVYLGTDGISCGTSFKVTKAGALTATSGTIGSITIASSYLYKGSGSSQAGLGGKYAFWAGADQAATGVFPFSVTYDGVVTAKDLTLYQDESSTCAISIYDSMNNQVLSFAGADGDNVVILSDCWFNKSLNVAGGITTDGNIVPNTSDTYDLGSSSQPFSYLFTDGIRIGRADYSAGAGFVNTRWKDGSAHNILYRSSDGLTSSVGWVGSSSYATVLQLNGRTVQVKNSSGTSTLSDERLKKDFRKLDAWENFYLDLEPIAYKYKDGSSGRNHMGFLAQQVEKALLNNNLTTQDFGGLIKYDVNPDDEDSWHGYKTEYGLIYTEFTALNTYMTQKNVKAIKHLDHRFTVLDGKVNSTYARMASAEERIDKLEKENKQLKEEIAQLKMAS